MFDQVQLSTRKHLMLNTISLIICSILSIVTLTNAICPDAIDIKPCTCDDEGLQCLRLNNTGLGRIFSAPAEKKAIRKVWIFQTNLTELPKRAFGDYIIRDLYLDLNKISHVEPGAFGEATATLQALSLTRNQLETFPFDELKLMPKLKQLGLGHNRLVKLESGAMPKSDTLESIDLSHNSLVTIEPFAFANLTEVSVIDLSRNRLKTIGSNSLVVKSVDRPPAISLRGNQIHEIATDAFGQFYYPSTLDLSKNNLTYLDQSVFEPMVTNNTVIYVDDNPFSCDSCDLFYWLFTLDSNSLNNIVNFVCADDTKLEELSLDMIGCPSTNA